MKLKKGCNLEGLKAPLYYALGVADAVWRAVGVELVVTAGIDGVHKVNSLHYSGNAVDLRTRDLTDRQKAVVFAELRSRLDTLGFDIVLEGEPQHVHCEYDPKAGDLDWKAVVD